MLDKDGQFLANILNIAPERFRPDSLCYNFKTHCVWVGSVTDIVTVNKYINRQDIQTGKFALFFFNSLLMHAYQNSLHFLKI